MHKRTKGEFDADCFIYFLSEEDKRAFNSFIERHGGEEKDKVPVKEVLVSEKPIPKLLTE